MLEMFLQQTTATCIALTGLVTAVVGLIQSTRPLLGLLPRRRGRSTSRTSTSLREVKWRDAVVALLLLAVVLTLSYFMSGQVAAGEVVRDVAQRFGAAEYSGQTLPQTAEKLADYLDRYEEVSQELQKVATFGRVFLKPPIRMNFSESQTPEGHYTLVEEPERARFLKEFEERYAEYEPPGPKTPPTVLIRAYAGWTGSSAYNRKVTLLRSRAVEEVLRSRYAKDKLTILSLPLGESRSQGAGSEWRFAEVLFLADPDPGAADPTPVDPLVRTLRVSLETERQQNAGTNSVVSLKIDDMEYPLSGRFEAGDHDTVKVELDPPIEPSALRDAEIFVGHDGVGLFSGWLLASIRIEYSLDRESYDVLGEWSDIGWLSKKQGLARRLTVQPPQPPDPISTGE